MNLAVVVKGHRAIPWTYVASVWNELVKVKGDNSTAHYVNSTL